MQLSKPILSIIFALMCVASAQTKESIPDRLVVQHRTGADGAATQRLFRAHGAIVNNHQDTLNISVLRVDPTRRDRIRESLESSGLFNFVEPDYIAHRASTPNDPDYSLQWHLPAINAPSAWNISTGSTSVPIAFIDSGVDPTHPDLAAKIVAGWSFLTGTSDTHDVYGHGTTTAGTAAAISNNSTGVAGVAWLNPIMPLVVLDSSDSASYSNIASAITYAAQHGVRIINISLAGSSSSSALQSAVNYAWSVGSVVFASAGNGGSGTLYYPAACQYVVSVAATDSTNTIAGWSSYGPGLSLSAPGVNVYTTQMGGGYGYASGTSYSSPIAAAVGALVLSAAPSLSASSLVSILENSATDLGATGYDATYGYGLVNAYQAVVNASSQTTPTPPSVSITAPTSTTVSGSINVQGMATDKTGIASIQFYIDGVLASATSSSPFDFPWNSATVGNGSHTLMVKATDTSSNVGSASMSVTVTNTTPSDTTPPSIYIQSPVNGAIVFNSLTITAVATDNVGVTQVCIYLDGVLYDTTTVSPYTYTLNARKMAAGAHIITAKAWDAAGNVDTSAGVTIHKSKL